MTIRCRARVLSVGLALGAAAIDLPIAGAAQARPAGAALSRAEVAVLVKADLAKRLKLSSQDSKVLEVVNQVDRQWPDASTSPSTAFDQLM
jgi:hypothetical protein